MRIIKQQLYHLSKPKWQNAIVIAVLTKATLLPFLLFNILRHGHFKFSGKYFILVWFIYNMVGVKKALKRATCKI